MTRSLGDYHGEWDARLDTPALRDWLGRLPALAASAHARSGQGGTRILHATAPLDLPIDVVAKWHGPQGLIKDVADRRRGTAAARAWRIARHLRERGVGTPEPLAWIERWNGARLVEALYVARRSAATSSFHAELVRMLHDEAGTDELMPLLASVAHAIRSLHDAGVMHGDLGNQNILLRPDDDGRWTDIEFIDLNRGSIGTAPLPASAIAFDLSRIFLPSDLLRIFFEMYFGSRIPPDLAALEARYRRRFAFHTRTRIWRHPIRTRQRRRSADPATTYPPPRDIWIWDERSAQPVNAWRRVDRNRIYPRSNIWRMALATLRHAPAVHREFSRLLAGAFRSPVELDGRWAIAVEPRPTLWTFERTALAGLGKPPVLIRLYRHKGQAQWDFAIHAARDLKAAGHRVDIALVQDRRAVRDPASWREFCEEVVPRIAGLADLVEAGHAINRVKWGVWTAMEYRRLLEPILDLQKRYPDLRITGPANIDFEYPQLLGFLDALPASARFAALSHHLYVDRRGAPENRQGRFDSVAKFALARAIARSSHRCDDRLVISEVNWPLADTGEYSPVCSPYLYPGQVVGAPNVGEDDYASFMVRYLLQSVCSGLVDRVVWWRLAARGYGLVDEFADPPRHRPAYTALRTLLGTLGGARFVGNAPAPAQSFVHRFEANGRAIAIGYTWAAAPVEWTPPFAPAAALDRSGEPIAVPARLTGSPVYLLGVTPARPDG